MLDLGVSQVVVIEQDYFRRKIFKEKDWHSTHKEAIVSLVQLSISHQLPVILGEEVLDETVSQEEILEKIFKKVS